MSQAAEQIGPAWRRFAFLYVCLVVLAGAALLVLGGPVYWAWVERFEGPELQKQFGFVAAEREIHPGRPGLVIVDVQPGGRFALAGVRPGDVVACLYHGRGDFWGGLMAVRDGHSATISVVQMAEVDRGCDGARKILLTR